MASHFDTVCLHEGQEVGDTRARAVPIIASTSVSIRRAAKAEERREEGRVVSEESWEFGSNPPSLFFFLSFAIVI